MIFENVKRLADKTGLSIMAVEQQAGIANGTIGKWRSATPRVDSLQSVAKVLGVTVSDLLENKKEG